MRFLGRVRHECSEAHARSVLLAEMLARVIKRQVNIFIDVIVNEM